MKKKTTKKVVKKVEKKVTKKKVETHNVDILISSNIGVAAFVYKLDNKLVKKAIEDFNKKNNTSYKFGDDFSPDVANKIIKSNKELYEQAVADYANPVFSFMGIPTDNDGDWDCEEDWPMFKVYLDDKWIWGRDGDIRPELPEEYQNYYDGLFDSAISLSWEEHEDTDGKLKKGDCFSLTENAYEGLDTSVSFEFKGKVETLFKKKIKPIFLYTAQNCEFNGSMANKQIEWVIGFEFDGKRYYFKDADNLDWDNLEGEGYFLRTYKSGHNFKY